MGYTDLLTPDNCFVALIDYQPAMYFGVQSHDRITIMHNSVVVAKTAKLFKIPTILSTVARDSFSGPLDEALTSIFKDQKVIDRTSINGWGDPNFRKAVEGIKRKKCVIGGLWTEACVLFPSLEMLKANYEIYVATDACGDVSLEAHDRSVQRLVQAGAVPITSLQFLFELQQDWARSATYDGVMEILKEESPYGKQVVFSHWALGGHGG